MNRRRLRNGLLEILALVEADVESDHARYKGKAVHDAIEWLNELRGRLRHDVLAPPVPREVLRGFRILAGHGRLDLNNGDCEEHEGSRGVRDLQAAIAWIDALKP